MAGAGSANLLHCGGSSGGQPGSQNTFGGVGQILGGVCERGGQFLGCGCDPVDRGDAVVVDRLRAGTDGPHDGDDRFLGSSGDADRDLSGQRLTVQLAFTGENEVGLGREFIKAHGIQHRFDTGFELGCEKRVHTGRKAAGCSPHQQVP